MPGTATASRFTFSLRTVLFVTACVAAILAARDLFVHNHKDGLGITIARAKLVTLMFAAAASLYVCTIRKPPYREYRSIILRACIVGGLAGFLTATCLGFEIAEGVRKLYPEYWIWRRDFMDFVWIIASVTVACIVVSVLTSSLYLCAQSLVERIGSIKS